MTTLVFDRVFVTTGYTDANQGADLYVQNWNGPHQVPWPGLLHYPMLGNIVEPAVAWYPICGSGSSWCSEVQELLRFT
jgi:hypothetical protein